MTSVSSNADTGIKNSNFTILYPSLINYLKKNTKTTLKNTNVKLIEKLLISL